MSLLPLQPRILWTIAQWVTLLALSSAALAAPAKEAVNAPAPVGERSVSLSLSQLGAAKLPMRTVASKREVYVGVRLDEVVEQAKLTLVFTPSPALLTKLSHLRVLLGDQLVSVIPITPDMLGTRVQRDLVLDPRVFSSDNWLRFEAVNHYTAECEDPLHMSLWNEIDTSNSVLHLRFKRLDLGDDLGLLPAPFFDRHDVGPVVVPVMLGPAPQHATLRVAGMMTSWLGALADYRTAQFPVVRGQIPTRASLVLAMPDDMPVGLDLPAVQGPTVRLMRHPHDARVLLLVLQGRHAQDLETAALGLILGRQALSGQTAHIQAIKDIPKRVPYDAPTWIRTDRPVRLGELVDTPKRLEVAGVAPEEIKLHWRTPPDLWLQQGQGATLDLRYRTSTAPKHAQGSLLRLSLNDTFIRSWNLKPVDQGSKPSWFQRWLPSNDKPYEQVKVRLFDFALGTSNHIAVNFPLGVKPVDGWCAWRVETTAAAIDASSTLDFSELPHYRRMPELSTFANAGFPFSRYADLAETAIVLPSPASEAELQSYLTVMGSFGRWTGTPALRFSLVTPQAAMQANQDVKDRDLLLIGGPGLQTLLTQWKRAPTTLFGAERHIRVASDSPPAWRNWWPSWGQASAENPNTQMQFSASGPLALIQGFESPLRSGRSVVALTSNDATGLIEISQALLDPARVASMQGDVAIVRANHVQSGAVGPSYYVGHLPISGHVSLLFTEYGWLVGFFAMGLLAVLVWLARKLLMAQAAKRLK